MRAEPGEADDPTGRLDDPGRRQFLLKAAALGAIAWAAPAIVTMEPAAAASLTSPPPKPPEVSPQVEVAPSPADPQVASATASRSGQLPTTGANIEQLVIAGLAATAGGAAMQFWSTKMDGPGPGSSDAGPPAPRGA